MLTRIIHFCSVSFYLPKIFNVQKTNTIGRWKRTKQGNLQNLQNKAIHVWWPSTMYSKIFMVFSKWKELTQNQITYFFAFTRLTFWLMVKLWYWTKFVWTVAWICFYLIVWFFSDEVELKPRYRFFIANIPYISVWSSIASN